MDGPAETSAVPARRRWLQPGEARSLTLEMITVVVGILLALLRQRAAEDCAEVGLAPDWAEADRALPAGRNKPA